tara:strand:- start:958 stop:5061 length:4104 start_codon:yes stop_codon:yes gene_type:complete
MRNIDWNSILHKVLDFLFSYIRPSLAKFVIGPILVTGLALLSQPLWIELLNWVLASQDMFPQWKKPIATANAAWGWSLILLSVAIYGFETFFQYKKLALESSKISDELVEDVSDETSKKVTEKLTEVGFTAPHLQDASIEQQISEIKEFRFFANYPKEETCRELAGSILDGEFKGASPLLKAKALALLSRYICFEEIELSKSYLKESKRLTWTEETEIAEACIAAVEGNEAEAIDKLLNKPMPLNYSAVFMLKQRKQKITDAIQWLFDSGLTIRSLDTDGQQSLLNSLLQAEQWEKALEQVDELGDLNQIESIGLSYAVAMSLLTNSVKVPEIRRNIILEVPFAAEKYPLADDAKSVELRLKSAKMFTYCSALIGCDVGKDIAALSNQYSLWLRLKTPETQEDAQRELQSFFSDYSIDSLKYLPLAFSFGLDVDYDKVEKEVDKLSILYGETKRDLGLARFILAHKQKGYTEALEYIRTHRTQIEKGVNPSAATMFEIEVLAGCGLVDEAEVLLESDNLVPEEQKPLLKNIIATRRGEDPIALAIEQYKETRKVSDLAQLVTMLSVSGTKDEFLSYAKELFEKTKTEADAINLANAYSKNEKFIELDEFLEGNKKIVDRSEPLKLHKAWSLFRSGNLKSARELTEELSRIGNERLDVETLDIHLNIYSGNWDALASVVEARWEKKEELSKAKLLQTASIAKAQLPNRAKEILEFATQKFPDDPEVLASAYFTATLLGWEDNKSSSEWLNRAAVLSSENGGPIHTGSFEDMKEMMYAQREQNDHVYKAYLNNEAPIFLLADLLHRSLSDFYLIQPFENTKNNSVHKKSAIAAFHSLREEKFIDAESITVDVSSVLTIGYLGLLDPFFKVFPKIVISHSLLMWLYEEKQKVAFHQPSQVSKAKNFESLILDDCIQVAPTRLIEDPKLALSVGDELAMLIETAVNGETVEQQCVVVSSYPAYHVGSFRQEEVDLSPHYKNLVSCVTLIGKLKELSLLTDTEHSGAVQYLKQQQHGETWPEEHELSDSASVYLDSLSVTYLMALGVLDKFKDTGIKLYVDSEDHRRYKALRNFDSTIQKADSVLDKIKVAFHAGLETGQVTLSEMLDASERKGHRIESTPISELFHKKCITGGVLIDDRTINQNANIQIREKTEPVFTTLDLLETLHLKGQISAEDKYVYRAKLRESGFGVISASSEEVQYHLDKSNVKDGVLRPDKELLLVKQHLSLLKVSGLIKLPRDAHWLNNTLKQLSDILKRQWNENISIDERIARSNWLYDLIDFRSWAQCHDIRNEDGLGYFGESLRINLLIVSTEFDETDRKVEYEKWLNDYVLHPLKNDDSISFNTVVASSKRFIKNAVETDLGQLEDKRNG